MNKINLKNVGKSVPKYTYLNPNSMGDGGGGCGSLRTWLICILITSSYLTNSIENILLFLV